MGTISHHQAKAHEFLDRADWTISIRDPAAVAAALRRAATHVITALAVHQGWPHKSRRQLGIALHANIASANLSYSHLKTLRQVHTPPHAWDDAAQPSHAEPDQARASGPALDLRRLRRRVAPLIKHVNAVISDNPPPVHYHKLWLRKPDLPVLPQLTYVQQILALPNYSEIRRKFRLGGVGMDTDPDPHGFYSRGDQPRRCPCHADLWDQRRNPNRITLSPPWRHTLEKTFRVRLADPLVLRDRC